MCLDAKCTSEDRLGSVADFILQRPLCQLSPSNGSIEDMTITLKDCGHTFTVETLDGHCQMGDYYAQDEEGHWLYLKDPPLGYKKPPSCPTCRSPITSPRYGRVLKRAHLDILEMNVATNSGRVLNQARQQFNSVDTTVLDSTMQAAISSIKLGKVDISKKSWKKRNTKQKGILNETRPCPVAWSNIDPGLVDVHGVSVEEAAVWRRVTKSLQDVYAKAFTIANTRSAHTNAWEAAFSFLYREEMDRSERDLTTAPRKPEEHAMRMAKMKIGQPKPLADLRFCVEAFWLSLSVRFIINNITKCWLNLVHSRPGFF